MNDFNSVLAPNLYSKMKEDGSLLGYFEKPIRRVSYWFDIISGISYDREIIENS
jgi:hypothetical protein